MELVFKVLLDRFVIFLLVATMTRIIFSFNVQMLAGSTGTTNFSHEYNLAASVFFTMFTCGGIIYIYKQSGKQNGIINF